MLRICSLTFLTAFYFTNAQIAKASKEDVRDSLVGNTFIEHTVVSAGLGGKSFFGNQVGTGFATWSWLVNDRVRLGLAGESMIAGKTRKISEDYIAEVSVWNLGPRAEYLIWSEGLLNLSAGSSLQYGNIGYRVDNGDGTKEWYSSDFFSVQPFAKFSVNFSKQVEIGCETFYSYAKGVSLLGIRSKDLSGIGGNVFLSRRF